METTLVLFFAVVVLTTHARVVSRVEAGSEVEEGGAALPRMRRQLDTLGGGHVPYGNNGHKVYKGGRWRKDRNEFLSEEDYDTLALTLDEPDDLEGYSSFTRPYLFGFVDQTELGERSPVTTASRARRHVSVHDVKNPINRRSIRERQRRSVDAATPAGSKGIKKRKSQGLRKGKGEDRQGDS